MTTTQERVLRSIGVIDSPEERLPDRTRPTPRMIWQLARRHRRALRPPRRKSQMRPDHAALHLGAMVDESTPADRVLALAAQMYGLTVDEVKRSRYKIPKWARWAAQFVMRHKLVMSFPDIARVFGSASHAGPLYSVKRVEAMTTEVA